MGRPTAIEVALALNAHPASVRWVSRLPLPGGMTALLEVAGGNRQEVHAAALVTQRAQPLLVEACGFFIEQVMFAEGADSYRVLGCRGREPRHKLRRHMALLLRWLHPDRLVVSTDTPRIDRTVFTYRVTQAWENLKSRERRAAYDRKIIESDRRGRLRGLPSGGFPKAMALRPRFHGAFAQPSRFGGPEMPRSDADTLAGRLCDLLQKDA